MNNEQQQIIDSAYENYEEEVRNLGAWAIDDAKDYDEIYDEESGDTWEIITPLSQEEFINKSKTNIKFSEKWGLKIEERELSSEEIYELADEKRWELVYDELNKDKVGTTDDIIKKYNIPTKLITITYKEQTIESYE